MDRRSFLSGAIGVAALSPDPAGAETEAPALRGSLDANARGIQPNSPYDQTRELTRLSNEAAAEDRPVYLPPGRYIVETLVLAGSGAHTRRWRGEYARMHGRGAGLVR